MRKIVENSMLESSWKRIYWKNGFQIEYRKQFCDWSLKVLLLYFALWLVKILAPHSQPIRSKTDFFSASHVSFPALEGRLYVILLCAVTGSFVCINCHWLKSVLISLNWKSFVVAKSNYVMLISGQVSVYAYITLLFLGFPILFFADLQGCNQSFSSYFCNSYSFCKLFAFGREFLYHIFLPWIGCSYFCTVTLIFPRFLSLMEEPSYANTYWWHYCHFVFVLGKLSAFNT